MEVLTPFIIDRGDLGQIYYYGALMLLLAFLSLLFGVLAGQYAAMASSW